MGSGSSAQSIDTERYNKHKELEAQMAKEAKQDGKKIKLLLLGAAESGKSTIFKQMKIIYGSQYTDEEKKLYVVTVHCNIIQAIKMLTEQSLEFRMSSSVLAKAQFDIVQSLDDDTVITPIIGDAIKVLWNDPGIKAVWDRRTEYQIIESVQYYFNKIDQIKMPNYLPDKDDILFSRVRTSGIITERYVIEGKTFEMYDVGGQRNERKKWIHCFEGVTGVIFVAALSEYDQRLLEDTSANRMVEALDLFEDIANNVYFSKSSMLLFLNKRDLFEEKIKTHSIKSIREFKDYAGPAGDYEQGCQYFVNKFLERNKSGDVRMIYHHLTCATDTKNVRIVFDACMDIILRGNLQSSGFIT